MLVTRSCRGLAPRAAAAAPPTLAAYAHAVRRQTRWNDNDAFGHVNNV